MVGSSGGIGAALVAELQSGGRYAQVVGLSRSTVPAIDYTQEDSLRQAAQWLTVACQDAPLRTLIVATGVLHGPLGQPEKTWSQLEPAYLHEQFAVNVVGPMLVMKHFFALLPKAEPIRVAFLSAKVGSIGDNALGGWYGYRAAKAALNQAVKTASIELRRHNKLSICVSLHPGTVRSRLSDPFHKTGLNVREPAIAASELVSVVHSLNEADTGGLFSCDGQRLPW